MIDYDVNVTLTINIGVAVFSPLIQKGVKHRITKLLAEMSGYITDFDYSYIGDGCIDVMYTFCCHDENEEEAESFARSFLDDTFKKTMKNYKLENIACDVKESDTFLY